MKLLVKKGATSYLALIFIRDSSSTTGAGLTGLTSASSGLVCYRARSDDGNAAGTAISLSGGTRGTWSSGGFVEKDATNMPGWYELGIPNAALATGSNFVGLHLKGATNMAPLPIEIQLTDFDPQDSVRLGLTALPNATASASGGLLTFGTSTGQINPSSGNVPITSSVKKNQALANFMFVMTDSTNHNPSTGLTVTSTRSIDGGAFASCTNSASELSNGIYKISLSASDLNGNVIVLRFTAASSDDTFVTIVTDP